MSTGQMADFLESIKARLAALLQAIKMHDTNYDARNPLVLEALYFALVVGLKAGIRIDPDVPAWPVIYIELPQGQVSWHLPEHDQPWDGHTTAEKYQRIDQYWHATMSQELPT